MNTETENLLFSVMTAGEEVSATEALLSFGVFQGWDGVQPLFPGNAVGKPIPVMTEGKYYLKTKVGGAEKYREVNFTKADIQRIAAKQPRDVPFNYDHRRAPGKDGVKGWLRFGRIGETPLHYVGTVNTPDGQQLTALFATPELSEEAQQMVTSGTYRDVSVEYRGMDDVLTGCALTSYPVMRNLQFSDLEAADSEESVPETKPTTLIETIVVSASPETKLSENQTEEEMDVNKIKELPKEQRAELLDALLGDHNLSLSGLVEMGEKFKENEVKTKETLRDAAMVKAEAEINSLLGENHFGMTDEIATQTQEVLAWGTLESTLNFGEDGGAPDVPGVVKSLLGVIGKQGKQLALLGGETVSETEDGEKKFGEVDVDETLSDVDKARVNSLTSLAKSFL